MGLSATHHFCNKPQRKRWRCFYSSQFVRSKGAMSIFFAGCEPRRAIGSQPTVEGFEEGLATICGGSEWD
jgi:hypothetical protein